MTAQNELMKARRASVAKWLATAASTRKEGQRLASLPSFASLAPACYRDALKYLGWVRVDMARLTEDGFKLP
jgi:hypothetical protein